MKTELIIVRHGETEWNKTLKFQGQTDINLNATGFAQANKLSNYMITKGINVIYASDLKRAYHTAETIAEPYNLQVKQLRGLREIDFGEWEGFSYPEIKERYPDLLTKWYNDPTKVHPPGGESLKDFQKRVVKAFTKITIDSSGEKILIVSHGGAIRVYLAFLLQMPLKLYWRLELSNTGISIVKFYDNNPVLKLLNSTIHLKD